MARAPQSAWVWLINLLVPGTGMVWLGSIGMGIALALIWAIGILGAILCFVWPDILPGSVARSLTLYAVAIYLVSQWVLQSRIRRLKRLRSDVSLDEKFKAALEAFLQNRYEEAERICIELLRQDPEDVEATLQLAAVAQARGETAAARRYLIRARYLDGEGRWDFHIDRRLASLTEPSGLAGGRS